MDDIGDPLNLHEAATLAGVEVPDEIEERLANDADDEEDELASLVEGAVDLERGSSSFI